MEDDPRRAAGGLLQLRPLLPVADQMQLQR